MKLNKFALTSLLVVAATVWGLMALARADALPNYRFSRQLRSQLDPGTFVDVVQDAQDQRCWAVYVVVGDAATTLGEVACRAVASGVR